MGLRRAVYSVVCVLVCAICACTRKATVCGVPYEGCSPWALAARIYDRGDRTFLPESVEFAGQAKAYIIGWSFPSEQRDTIICDLRDGGVVHAVVASTISND